MLRERDREELLEMDPVQKRRLQEANERFSSPETKRRLCERQGRRADSILPRQARREKAVPWAHLQLPVRS